MAELDPSALRIFKIGSTPFVIWATRPFVLGYRDSILGFTYKEKPEEFFLTTCLSAREMSSVDVIAPVEGFNFHYELPFVKPRVRNWSPFVTALKLHERWEDKIRPPAPHTPTRSD